MERLAHRRPADVELFRDAEICDVLAGPETTVGDLCFDEVVCSLLVSSR
jgi:hypothetical protein